MAAGAAFGFLGPNGAGRSTTIRTLLGLVRPTAGRAFTFDTDAADVAAAHRLVGLPATRPAGEEKHAMTCARSGVVGTRLGILGLNQVRREVGSAAHVALSATRKAPGHDGSYAFSAFSIRCPSRE